MASQGPFSKREVSRAGAHLASRLVALRQGNRPSLVDPDDPDDVRARDAVEWWRGQHIEPMLAVQEETRKLAPPLVPEDTEAAVSFRPKRFESMIDKLTREPGKLADMADVGGVRAVVSSQDEVDELHRALSPVLEIRRLRDWARQPPADGYRAVHLHVRFGGFVIEIQLRTFWQDAWANVVEEESRLSGVNYKGGQGRSEVLLFFRALADLFAGLDTSEPPADIGNRLYASYGAAKAHLRMPLLRNLDS